MEKYERITEKADGFVNVDVFSQLKQLPFPLMYLLFRKNDCLYCKCGILPKKSPHTSQAAHQDCSYIWFIL